MYSQLMPETQGNFAPEPIVVIDLGISNVNSVVNMCNRLGFHVRVADKPSIQLHKATFILPGVGSFDEGVRRLKSQGWKNLLVEHAASNQRIIGLCLGMQLLCQESEEGHKEGLSLIPGRFKRFNTEDEIKVPHMGWNTVSFNQEMAPWSRSLPSDSRFYFVHSFHYESESFSEVEVGWTDYGLRFASVIQKSNIIGVQFHPEKSHRFGMELLRSIVVI